MKWIKKLFTKKQKAFETYEEWIEWINSSEGHQELVKNLKLANDFSEQLKKDSKVTRKDILDIGVTG